MEVDGILSMETRRIEAGIMDNITDFDITMNDNTIIFPHKIFEHSGKVSLVELSAIFKIFEISFVI